MSIGDFDRVDEARMVGFLIWENDSGEEIETEFPLEYTVCSGCQGKGKHVHRAIDGHGLTREDFDEDPDFAEAYFSGRYDVTCEECDGARVVPVLALEEERFTPEQRDAWAYACECARHDAMDRATMRAECGGRG